MITAASPTTVVGYIGWDNTAIDDSMYRSLGGAVVHFSAAAALFGFRPKIVSYADPVSAKHELGALRCSGIDITEIRCHGDMIEFYLYYDAGLIFRSDRFSMVTPLSAPSLVDLLLGVVQRGCNLHICPTDPSTDARLVELGASNNCIISLQLHINNLAGHTAEYRSLLRHVRTTFMNVGEFLLISGVDTMKNAPQFGKAYGETEFVITSEKRVWVMRGAEILSHKTIETQVVDPTGAGDVFAGGYTAGLALSGERLVALRYGVLAAALKLSGLSSAPLLRLLR